MSGGGMRAWSRLVLTGALAVTATATAVGCRNSEAATAAVPSVAPAQANKEAVRRSFDAWAAHTGGPFELLDEHATWTVTGKSLVSKTYPDREAFMREVIRPFNARLKEPLTPVVRGIHADGDMVVVLFDASGVALDGQPYRNTYSWHLRMRQGRVVEVTAFFDSIAFNDLWTRVAPASG